MHKKKRLAVQAARVADLQAAEAPLSDATIASHRGSRRQLLRLAGGVAAGGAASVIAAGRAAAEHGIAIVSAGPTTTDDLASVTYTGTGTTSGHIFLFRGSTDAPLATEAGDKGVLTGASASGRAGVVGLHSGSGTGGKFASKSGTGLVGESESNSGAVFVSQSGASVSLTCLESGNHLWFAGTPGSARPQLRTSKTTLQGTVTGFGNGDIWACVKGGAPGTWRKIVGPATAGTLHPIATARVYDSRKTMTPMASGMIATGQSRTIDVSNQRDTGTGAVTLANVVPEHATAVAFNLTVVNTVGTNGFLAVEPGDAVINGGSTINWSSAGLTTANGSLSKLDGSRQLKVFCGGTDTSAHFIIDIVGYYL